MTAAGGLGPARRHPVLYQVNTRVLLRELSARSGRAATLDDVPDRTLDEVAERGFDWLWLLGVWRIGPAARAVSRSREDWLAGFRRDLPDLAPDDVTGSPFAVQAYQVDARLGGDAALARMRARLARRSVRLLLDFVPNHVSPDHPWVAAHPDWFVEGTEADLAGAPANWGRVATPAGPRVLAHGRDPYFPGWPDTLQLDYRMPALREAMARELRGVAARCDGVRCDMAMLVLPEVFRRTWGDRPGAEPGPFWPEAIRAVRAERPGFLFMAEVYWDLEWELQQQGFDFTYDKRLYDRLRAGPARPVREHLLATPEFQERSVRFLENHDEPRAAATFDPERHRAAAAVVFLVPGLRFLHEGQLEGRRAHVSMHLDRRPAEPPDPALGAHYDALLRVLRRPETHEGAWRLRACRPAWEGNPTWDDLVAFSWEAPGRRLLVAVNLSPHRAQGRADVAFEGLEGRSVELVDLLGPDRYVRDGYELCRKGLYLDVPAWRCHAFEVRPR
jgi:glycosidase